MQHRMLGETGLTVSRMGLGMAALGRPGYINLGHAADLGDDHSPAVMQEHAACLLDLAWQEGITYFDAARSYGQAERFLSEWLKSRRIPSGNVVIGSKWGYTYTAEWQIEAAAHEVKQHSIDKLVSQWSESSELLGGFLDLYQIHSATLESGVLDNRDVLEKLSELKQRGVKIGLSVSGPRQADVIYKAIQISIGGSRLFDTVQATWNLLEQSSGPALAQAHAAGLGVIVKEGVANGRLTERNQQAEFQNSHRLLQAEAQRLNTTIDGLCLAGILAQPWVDIVLSGAASPAHLKANLNALQVKFDEQAAESLKAICESPEEYWKTRGQLQWN